MIAGRSDNDDARLRRLLDGLDQRVGRGRFEDRMTERQVDDVDAQRLLVRDRKLDRSNHVAGLAAAVLVEHLESNEADARRHALVVNVGRTLQSANQAGDMGAVTVIVERVLGANAAGGEIVKRLDAIAERR